MQQLWPVPESKQVDSDPETAGELESFYEYPPELSRPWVRVNFVSSLDGAVAVNGGSRGLSNSADRRVLSLIRDLSDVVLVGAGTATAEGYRGVRRTEARTRRRTERGLSEVPPIAVVTGSGSVDPASPLLTDTFATPIVLTSEAAPAERVAALTEAGAEVVTAGRNEVDLPTALRELARRGLYRIGCEGGPGLFGSLIAADVVDELCLTVSPLLTSGNTSRIATGPAAGTPRDMRLLSALYADESMLLLRYGRLAE
ncbi:5-amino-6-(5-phosphoribosylamino)uracil reductase [Actinopolyspora mzabensis]|uniref:5-amino-6-(5-phosphoribosylamino)uracil reductase n=1 Tax=Actinopolyspora mzabensis TaxID=995066 RepID=A0A1G9BGY6_ACTMZ|nr:pyrimidine reductase family protein [Actinopolyspora mzabensis]SDK38354.1 5-amino-6-(5-phosphoribosylamino)uracil reductase [Actinopolyspora mzabensis]